MKKIGIVGLGNMGEAVMRALLAGGLSKEEIIFHEVKEARAKAIAEKYAVGHAASPEDVAARCASVLVAVKPQDAKAALAAIAPSLDDTRVVISVMAGVTTSGISSMLGRPARIVRIMPNIGVMVGEGAVGMCANYLVSPTS
jgi:pyrroline-5-carboxylate reductase